MLPNWSEQRCRNLLFQTLRQLGQLELSIDDLSAAERWLAEVVAEMEKLQTTGKNTDKPLYQQHLSVSLRA